MAETIIDVTESAAIDQIIRAAKRAGYIALDTEFQRTRTYYPIASIYQVRVNEITYLIDSIAINDLNPLKQLLDTAGVTKVMHGCSEDMALFSHHLDLWPDEIFDTQLAAAFVGYPYQLGYKGLVAQVFDIELSKSETRSDWLRRPLSAAQRQYAAEDVAYLPTLYTQLTAQLQRLGRVDWYQAELKGRYLASDQHRFAGPWRNYKGAWSLKGVAAHRFQSLWAWREDWAQSRNKPRQWLVGDKLLHELARADKASDEIFKKHQMKNPKVMSQMRRILTQTNDISASEWPTPPPKPLDADERPLFLDLQKRAQERADVYELPLELMINKKMLSTLVHCYRQHLPMPSWWGGWREEVLGTQYLQGC